MIELRDVKWESLKMFVKYIENQDSLEKAAQEVEKLRLGYDEFDSWVKEKIERMRYERWKHKGRWAKVSC